LPYPHDIEDDREGDNESEIQLANGVRNSDMEQQWHVCTILNIPGLIQLTMRSNTMAETVLMMVGTMGTRRNQGIKKK